MSLSINVHKITVKKAWQTKLKDISINLYSSELCAVIGPSGSGKSVLFESLMGFHSLTDGKINIDHSSTAFVPQKDYLHESLTINQALKIQAKLRNLAQNRGEELIQNTLEKLGLKTVSRELISSLSGGQKKRVSIALELLSAPHLLLLDEPSAGLDPQLEQQLINTFLTLVKQGHSILFSTHNTSLLNCCHCLIVIKEGQCIYFGTPLQAKKHFKVNELHQIYAVINNKKNDFWLTQYVACKPFLSRKINSKVVALPSEEGRRKPVVKTTADLNHLTKLNDGDKAQFGVADEQAHVISRAEQILLNLKQKNE